MARTWTRREFLIAAGLVTGGAVALDLSRGVLGMTAEEEPVLPSETYGSGGTMDKRVLVGYATRTGSTTGVAEAIAEELGARGYSVDLKPLKERPAVTGYDAVLLGSAVNGGTWLPEAVQFAKSNASALKTVPTALFSVHIMNLGADEKAARRRKGYTAPVRECVSPVAEAFFAGKGPEQAETSLIARWAFKAFGGGGEGDCRDWEAIRNWARKATIERAG
jgi:menaquinone-dependent protoporphyrinogen oxidase